MDIYNSLYIPLKNHIESDKNKFDQILSEYCLKRIEEIKELPLSLLNHLISTSSIINILKKDKKNQKIQIESYDRESDNFRKKILNNIGLFCNDKIIYKKDMLFFSANPRDYYYKMQIGAPEDIGLTRDLRNIKNINDSSSKIKVEEKVACTINDLKTAFQYGGYEILHYSGHANEEGIVLEGENNNLDFITSNNLSNLLRIFSNNNDIEFIFFNACLTTELGLKLTKKFPNIWFMGYDTPIQPNYAEAISLGFYSALKEQFNVTPNSEEVYINAYRQIWLRDDIKSLKEHTKIFKNGEDYSKEVKTI